MNIFPSGFSFVSSILRNIGLRFWFWPAYSPSPAILKLKFILRRHQMEGITHPIPRTVEEVFSDFRGRRAGLIKALTNGEFRSSLSLCSISLLSDSGFVLCLSWEKKKTFFLWSSGYFREIWRFWVWFMQIWWSFTKRVILVSYFFTSVILLVLLSFTMFSSF